jgi:hypothetical protein
MLCAHVKSAVHRRGPKIFQPSPSYACVFIYLESEKEGHVQAKYDFELNWGTKQCAWLAIHCKNHFL